MKIYIQNLQNKIYKKKKIFTTIKKSQNNSHINFLKMLMHNDKIRISRLGIKSINNK